MSKKRKMSELPREICTEILCRLPIRSMIESKRVCPAWRNLIESPEFAQFVPLIHMVEFPRISTTPPPVPLIRPYKIDKVRGDFNISIVKMGLADSVPVVRASVNGLILLLHRLSPKQQQQQQLWVCNPITREYLAIPNPPRYVNYDFGYGSGPSIVMDDEYGRALCPNTAPDYGNYNFGFGASRRSNEYKVVWISGRSEWHVFTLGTRGWRTLANGPTLSRYNRWNTECAFLAGNLYWLDPDESRIWCFDLETEVFTTFSSPPPPDGRSYTRRLSVLTECLCLCDASWNNAGDSEIEVGLMSYKEKDGAWSWSRQYVIGGNFGMRRTLPNIFPIKVLGDGSVLLGERGKPNIYCHTNGVRRLYPTHRSFGFELGNWYPNAALFTPNFLPLKALLKDVQEEEIQSF